MCSKYAEFADCRPIKTLSEAQVREAVLTKYPGSQIIEISERPNRVWDVKVLDHKEKLVIDYTAYQDRDVVRCHPPIRYLNIGNFADDEKIAKFLASLDVNNGPWLEWFDNLFCQNCELVEVNITDRKEVVYTGDHLHDVVEAAPCEDIVEGKALCPYKVDNYTEEEIIRMWLNARKDENE